ncbi:MAG: ATP-binding protein [Ruminiclostridium sp.]|nr:ATP-binding protein [Ruminiclostridium sp.]
MDYKELETEASVDNLDAVIGFITGELEAVDCPMPLQMQTELAVEEIFVNIASYAYAPGTGNAVIRIGISDEPRTAEITFIDSGVKYDPLAKEDPDITLSASERGIGGLGIFLTKKNMDEVSYEYRDGKNIFTMKKHLFVTK